MIRIARVTFTYVNSYVTDTYYTLNAGDTFILGIDGVLTPSNGQVLTNPNFNSSLALINVEIEGGIFATGAVAIDTGYSKINVDAGGVVSGDIAILVDFNSIVKNAGEIQATSDGVYFNVPSFLTATLVNSGDITAEDLAPTTTHAAVFLNGPSSTGSLVTITNTGTISGVNADGIAAHQGYAGINLTNSGLVEGGGSYSTGGSPRDLVAIEGGILADTIINTGTIRTTNPGGTAISTYEGADSLTNSGMIIGNVNLGGDDDTYDGRLGSVTGTVFGSDGDDTLMGSNTADDVFDGGAGYDLLIGGGGNDTASYQDSQGGLTVSLLDPTQNTGDADGDAFVSIENLTGSSYSDILTGDGGANTLTGNSGSDVLDGGAGADIMIGGSGDDTYYVDNSADVVRESNNAGTDKIISTASYSLHGCYVETLMLAGTANVNATGNNLDNLLFGNAGNNVLDGSGGNDTLSFFNATAAVTANLLTGTATGAGTDKLVAIENLTGSAYADSLTGNTLDNVIDGGVGADTMSGGTGDDTYYVDNTGDNVVETSPSGGDDTIYSSVSYSLKGRFVEHLTLTGTADINATGNNQLDNLVGNDGNNILDGQGGTNYLTGGAGADTFRFDSAIGGNNISAITDFTVGTDMIALDKSIFKALGADGALDPSAFGTGKTATTADQRILYDSASGEIFYDADGTGSAAATLFALVNTGLSVTASSFTIQG
jgi:serralysin